MSSLILASPGGKGLELNKLLWQVGFWLQHISHSSPCPWHLSSEDLRGISRYEIPATPRGGSTAACREGTEVLSSGAVGVFLARGEQKLFAAISSCSKRCFGLAHWGQMFTRTSGRAGLGAAYGAVTGKRTILSFPLPIISRFPSRERTGGGGFCHFHPILAQQRGTA